MVKTTTIALSVIFAVLVIYLFPKQTISPGDLSGGHQSLENDCIKCHTMFFGTPAEKCTVCHRPEEIGIVTTAGAPIKKISRQGRGAFHHLLSGDSCVSCHKDHAGNDLNQRVRKFSHTMLKGKNMDRCRTCHQPPGDSVHRSNKQECSQCHTSHRWRPAAFAHAQYFRFDKDHTSDCASCHQENNFKEYTCFGCHEHQQEKVSQEHEKVRISSYQDCILCHRSGSIEEAKGLLKSIRDQHVSMNRLPPKEFAQAEGRSKSSHAGRNSQSMKNCVSCHRSPLDSMHQTGTRNCTQCHSTDRWRPAVFDHARSFRFDRQHGPDCLACHRDNNYRDYTCYGCHEHSPGKIQKEHREEGIRDYQDCAACHRSSNEDEAKRILRSGRYQERSWNVVGRDDYIRQDDPSERGYFYRKDHDRHEDEDGDDDD